MSSVANIRENSFKLEKQAFDVFWDEDDYIQVERKQMKPSSFHLLLNVDQLIEGWFLITLVN